MFSLIFESFSLYTKKFKNVKKKTFKIPKAFHKFIEEANYLIITFENSKFSKKFSRKFYLKNSSLHISLIKNFTLINNVKAAKAH